MTNHPSDPTSRRPFGRTGLQVTPVGTYPIEATGDDDVVQALYSKATVQGNLPAYQKMFDVPPAEVVQCLNPAFVL